MASVPRQILEAVKTFKTLERNARHIAGFGKTQVDRYSGAAIFPGLVPRQQTRLPQTRQKLKESDPEPRT